jgi:hypothetical protein
MDIPTPPAGLAFRHCCTFWLATFIVNDSLLQKFSIQCDFLRTAPRIAIATWQRCRQGLTNP